MMELLTQRVLLSLLLLPQRTKLWRMAQMSSCSCCQWHLLPRRLCVLRPEPAYIAAVAITALQLRWSLKADMASMKNNKWRCSAYGIVNGKRKGMAHGAHCSSAMESGLAMP